ncbi:transposase [Cognatilysobacter lacus]|uniref:Transposase n=1 Tax=Cognatilysobacter lacus TaxID=1643323 RepID=A0A5D8YRJ4_9GAMM|nr:transposase [Lysobacter lacus]TZF82924.1 transposase [Lysobacter lacus]
MARLPRLDLPGIPQHVVQRGNDRQPCFARDEDYQHYRQELGEAALKHGCELHAYVLMTNHVHLLVTPSTPGGVSRMMQAIGRRYVACFNSRYRRTGTLWEGRFKSALVDSDRYVLACYRYIELNPVRAHMVADASEYPWSSFHANALGRPEARVRPHPSWTALGTSDQERRCAYIALVRAGISDDEQAALNRCTAQQKAWGGERFRKEIEALVGRTVELRTAGRPRVSRANGT